MAYRGESHCERLRQSFGSAGSPRRDPLHAVAVEQGDGRGAGLESARDVKRCPRRIGLVLGKAEGVFARVAEYRAVDPTRDAAAHVAYHELQGASYRRVG